MRRKGASSYENVRPDEGKAVDECLEKELCYTVLTLLILVQKLQQNIACGIAST